MFFTQGFLSCKKFCPLRNIAPWKCSMINVQGHPARLPSTSIKGHRQRLPKSARKKDRPEATKAPSLCLSLARSLVGSLFLGAPLSLTYCWLSDCQSDEEEGKKSQRQGCQRLTKDIGHPQLSQDFFLSLSLCVLDPSVTSRYGRMALPRKTATQKCLWVLFDGFVLHLTFFLSKGLITYLRTSSFQELPSQKKRRDWRGKSGSEMGLILRPAKAVDLHS